MQTLSPSTKSYVLWVLLFLGVFTPVAAHSQVVTFTGGTSTLLHASGGQADYSWNGYSGYLSLGYYQNSPQVGALLSTRLRNGYQLGVGDVDLRFTLDSDLFEGGPLGFSSRGVFLSQQSDNRSWKVFAGESTQLNYMGFYRSSSAADPTGAISYSQKLSPRLNFHSTEIIQDKITALQSLRYQIADGWALVSGAGIGRNEPYVSFGTDVERSRFHFTGAYTAKNEGFQRFIPIKTTIPERNGLNLRLVIHSSRHWSLNAAHENISSLQDTSMAILQKVRMDSLGGNARVRGFQISGSLTNSDSGPMWTHTRNASISRQLFNRFLDTGVILTKLSNQNGNNLFTIFTAQENVSPRLSFREMFTHGNNRPISGDRTSQNTLTAGGTFRSNRFSLGLEQQVVYDALPTGGKSVYKAWAVNLKFALTSSLRVNANSFIDQTGQMRYTSYLDGLLLARGGDMSSPSGQILTPDFGKFLVKGIVQDESGRPIWGIRVQVDGQTAYSDNSGQFYIRFRKGETYPVQVLLDQSLAPQRYELVSAPVSATGELPDMAKPLMIIVRLTKTPPPPTPTRKSRSALEETDRPDVPGNL